MLSKLALWLHGKVLAAVLAAAVVIGGGTAVAFAASSGSLLNPHAAATTTASSHDGSSDDNDGGATKTPTADNENDDQHERSGTVSNISADSFTLTPAKGTPLTVTVSAQTQFYGDLKGLSGLKSGDHVEVEGTLQSNGAFAASDVERGNDADANDDDSSGSDGTHQGTQYIHGTVVSVGNGSFVITVSGSEEDGSSNGSVHAGAHLTITVSSVTTFKNLSGLGALKAGDQVEVTGALQADGTFAATSVASSSWDGTAGGGSGGMSGD